MNSIRQKLGQWGRFLQPIEPEPAEIRKRIRYMEGHVGLPVRAVVVAMLFYYLFFSRWVGEPVAGGDPAVEVPPSEMILEVVRLFFLIYLALNAGFASLILGMRQLPVSWVQQTVFSMAWIDALFLATLAMFTGGFESVLYWVFVGLILRNAISTPNAARQIALNIFATACYGLAGAGEAMIRRWEIPLMDDKVLAALQQGEESGPEPFLLRITLLILMTACCYGVQVLLDKQRRVDEEAREYAVRQQQLQATGRLAAEIAHQLKNPLGIINNAAFTLQRTVKEGKTITQQISIIREEVERSDRIITELMGYARLSEGRIEKINASETLDSAIDQVFPAAAKYEVQIQRNYAPALPPLLMQKSHLSEVFMNLLINAREAMNGKGNILVTAAPGENYSVVVTIEDNGPGIPREKLPLIFEPYFTTKEKGSGLGLAIVKHNAEIYGGTVSVESELGKGTRFTIKLPARTLMKIRK